MRKEFQGIVAINTLDQFEKEAFKKWKNKCKNIAKKLKKSISNQDTPGNAPTSATTMPSPSANATESPNSEKAIQPPAVCTNASC